MLLFELSILFSFSYGKMNQDSFHKRESHSLKCSVKPPSNKYNLILNEQNETEFTNKMIYGCQMELLSKELKLNNCILRLYNCNFTNLNKDKKAIYFCSDLIPSQVLGNIEIKNCNFYDYSSKIGGTLYISSHDISRTITISSCIFSSSSAQQSEKGGAMYINAHSVKIKNTIFNNCMSEKGGAIYYTNNFNKQIISNSLNSFAIKIKKCFFNNNNAQFNGGSIFLSTQNYESSIPIEIKQCVFNSSLTKDSKESKGAGIYIQSTEPECLFNIIECEFSRCISHSKGGAIYFNAISGNIKGCTFSNNEAKDGDAIYYMYGSNEQNKGQFLTITENKFIEDSLNNEKDSPESLIYASFSSNSKIVFTNNQVQIDENSQIYVFNYPDESRLTNGQMIISGNKMPGFNDRRFERKNLLNSLINDQSAALLEDAYCPEKDYKYLDQLYWNDKYTGEVLENDKYYSCNTILFTAVSTMDSHFGLYGCTFNNGKMYSTYALQITFTNPEISATVEIINCYFNNCKNGGIKVLVMYGKGFLNITGCHFEECESNDLGTAINFIGFNGVIQNCRFVNNLNTNTDKNGGVIYYEYLANTVDDTTGLLIKDNVFEQLNSQYTAKTFINFGSFNANLRVTSNQFIFPTSVIMTIFNSKMTYDSFFGYEIKDNEMFPLREDRESILGINASSLDIGNFVEVKDYEFKCPSEDGYDVILPKDEKDGDYEDQKIYACDQTLTKQISAINCVLTIRYCTFNDFDSSVISIMNIGSSFTEKTEISYCTFSNHKDTSIDITVEDSNLIEIVNCTFKFCSSASSGPSAINFNALNGRIERCHFYNNQCIAGKGDISYEPNKVSDCKFTVTNNTFERSSSEYGKGSFFYYSYNENSKLDFNYNKFIVHIGLKMKLFDCDTPYSSYTNWIFSNNCMKPYRSDIILSKNAEGLPIDDLELCDPGMCEELAAKYDDKEVYYFDCGSYYDTTEGLMIDTSIIIAIFHCSFNSINDENYKYGAIYISISLENPNIKESTKIYNCDFSSCIAENGGAIYIESTVSSRLYEIQDCYFNNIILFGGDDDNTHKGGAIYINAALSSFQITRCIFDQLSAGNGAGIYYEYNSQKSLLEEPSEEEIKYSLHVTGCIFKDNSFYANGGCLCISIIKGEPPKPIEIENCTFQHNTGKDFDEEDENGGAIYYSFASNPSSKTLLEASDYSFHVYNCTFLNNEISSNGGGIYISISNGKPSNLIEINQCVFNGNKVEKAGADIYYYLDSSSSSSNNFAFQVKDCKFSTSLSDGIGGSLYLSVDKDESPKNVEINGCSFVDCMSNKLDAIYITSTNPSTLFHIDNCNFEGMSTVSFNAISGTIEGCHFNNIGSEITYNCKYEGELTDSQCFTIDKCVFNQTNKLTCFLFVVQTKNSNLKFTNNDITIENDDTRVFDLESFDLSGPGTWYFENNAIYPQDGQFINTDRAEKFPPSCANGFICPVPSPTVEITPTEEETPTVEITPSEEESPTVEVSPSNEPPPEESSSDLPSEELPTPDFYPGTNCEKNKRCFINGTDLTTDIATKFIDISLSQFESLYPPPIEDGGGAIHLINYGIHCDDVTTFNNCTSSDRGGGAIYIHIDYKLSTAVYIQNITFTNCRAVYGGAVYIYCENEENDVQIISCKFITNEASKRSLNNDHLFGGSAIYMTSANGNIVDCLFTKNMGAAVKIYNVFEKTTKSIKAKDDEKFVSFSGCSFEIDEDASSSILYIRGDGSEVPYEVRNCTFTGKLAKGSHHITGVSLVDKKEAPKLHIKSCKFASDSGSAISFKMNDSLSLLDVFDPNAQEFNFIEKKNDNADAVKHASSGNSSNSGLIYSLFLLVACCIAVLSFFVFRISKKVVNDDSENVLELNFA